MDSNNGTSPKIAAFDAENKNWYEFSQELHSTNTSELVVSNYPPFSLDCVRECDCGIKKNRIFDANITDGLILLLSVIYTHEISNFL